MRCALVLVALCALSAGDRPVAAEERARDPVEVAVIVHTRSPVREVSVRDLRMVFGSESRERELVPLNRPVRSLERVAFDRAVLGLWPSEVGRYWVDREVRGERGPPRSFTSERTVVRLVMRFPQAIGYVRADRVPQGVRVVRVAGLLPGDRGYPIVARDDR